jgi:cell shape-determining protein MreC
MARTYKDSSDDEYTPLPPATTPEGREQQLIELANNLVEKRLSLGTASAQETVFFLKQGSTRERAEREKLERENILLQARVKEMESRSSSAESLDAALKAFRGYAGLDDIAEDEDAGYTDVY